MPYCRRCGEALREDAKYCPSCGTYVGLTPERRRIERERRRPPGAPVIFLIVLVASAAIIVALASLPVRALDVTRQHTVPYVWAGMDTLKVDLSADLAGIDVAFERRTVMGEDLAVGIDVFATARVGILGAPDFLKLTSQNAIDGNVLTVTSEVEIAGPGWPPYILTNVTCVIRIDPSLNTTLDIRTATGGIVVHTQAGVVLDSLSLETTTGGIEVNLAKDVLVSGDLSLNTATGGVRFSLDNVLATKDVLVDVTTTTGGVDVDVKQDERPLGNITLKAEATTGGLNFAIDIQGDTGAKIDSSVTTGGIDIDRQVGFSLVYSYADRAGLLSDNHPARNNFDVSLRTTTGGIDIDARYTP